MIRWQQYSWMLLQNFFKDDKNNLLIDSSFISCLFPLAIRALRAQQSLTSLTEFTWGLCSYPADEPRALCKLSLGFLAPAQAMLGTVLVSSSVMPVSGHGLSWYKCQLANWLPGFTLYLPHTHALPWWTGLMVGPSDHLDLPRAHSIENWLAYITCHKRKRSSFTQCGQDVEESGIWRNKTMWPGRRNHQSQCCYHVPTYCDAGREVLPVVIPVEIVPVCCSLFMPILLVSRCKLQHRSTAPLLGTIFKGFFDHSNFKIAPYLQIIMNTDSHYIHYRVVQYLSFYFPVWLIGKDINA